MNRLTSVFCVMVFCIPACCSGAEPDLMTAVRNDDIASILLILKNAGPEASVHSAEGVTPMHMAAAMNKAAVIDILASFGVNADPRSSSGFTPLHWAASRDAVKAMRSLINAGADPSAKTPSGITPLHWAASKNATNAVAFLLKHNGSIESKTASGLRPLHWAVMKEAEEAANLLAFTEISAAIETQQTAVVSFEPDNTAEALAAQDGIGRPSAPAGMTPVVQKGHSFTIPIGAGEELTFIWIDNLKTWFGKYEITNGQYRRYRHSHSSMFVESETLNAASQPVVFVTWNDAKDFCSWLNINYAKTIPEGWFFRLPTSSEWTDAARCGTDRIYPWGNSWPPQSGNYSDEAARKVFANWQGIEGYNDGYAATCPVTESGTNEWSIFGMGGNVWEWCEDWYDRDCKNKVRHGGGWDFDVKASLKINYRGFDRPGMKYDTVGFRVVIAKRPSAAESQ